MLHDDVTVIERALTASYTEKPSVVSFEIRPFGDEDPEIVIANAKRTLNEAWARV